LWKRRAKCLIRKGFERSLQGGSEKPLGSFWMNGRVLNVLFFFKKSAEIEDEVHSGIYSHDFR
jgi:hypothetical protein